MTTSLEERARRASRTIRVGMAGNIVLAAAKLAAGILGSSAAVIADAVNSLSDIVTDLAVLLGFSIVRKPADRDHQYGHGKVETLLAVIIGGGILLVGFDILRGGAASIWRWASGETLPVPGGVALLAAVFSTAVKEGLYRYTIREGMALRSQAVIAKAWDHRSDVYSSLGVFAGVGGAVLLGGRWTVLDPAAAIVVSVFILRTGVRVVRTGVSDLLETSVGEETEREITRLVESVPGILNAHDLKTRRIGNAIAIDLHIEVECSLTVAAAHDLATEAECRIRDAYGAETVVNVHVEPK